MASVINVTLSNGTVVCNVIGLKVTDDQKVIVHQKDQENPMVLNVDDFKISGSTEKTRKRIMKKSKDPNKPKRAPNAQVLYAKANPEIIEEMMKEYTEKRGAYLKCVHNAWENLDEEKKEPYVQEAEKLKKEYFENMKTYKPSAQEVTSDSETEQPKKRGRKKKAETSTAVVVDVDNLPKAPAGWEGPFQGTLKKYPTVDNKRFQTHYETLDEAIDRAKTMSEVSGIVKDAKGFCLRVNLPIVKNKDTAKKGEYCWIKSEKKSGSNSSPVPAEEPVAKEPVAEKPVAEEPVAEEPVVEESTTDTVEQAQKDTMKQVNQEFEEKAKDVRYIGLDGEEVEKTEQEEQEEEEEEEEEELEEWVDSNDNTWYVDSENTLYGDDGETICGKRIIIKKTGKQMADLNDAGKKYLTE